MVGAQLSKIETDYSVMFKTFTVEMSTLRSNNSDLAQKLANLEKSQELQLSSLSTSVSTGRVNLNDEVARATESESSEAIKRSDADASLNATVNTVQPKLNFEISRATVAETVESSTRASADSTLTTNLFSEVSRASAQESKLFNLTSSLNSSINYLGSFVSRKILLSPSTAGCDFPGLAASSQWTSSVFSGASVCGRKVDVGGCTSVFINIQGQYSKVVGYTTLYPYNSVDGFYSATTQHFAALNPQWIGESLSFWAGSTLLWDYVMGSVHGHCPPTGTAAPSQVGNSWSCSESNPAFGSTALFTAQLPAATTGPIELRLCIDQVHADEDIYVGVSSIEVS